MEDINNILDKEIKRNIDIFFNDNIYFFKNIRNRNPTLSLNEWNNIFKYIASILSNNINEQYNIINTLKNIYARIYNQYLRNQIIFTDCELFIICREIIKIRKKK